MRLLFDTNVLFSAFVAKGVCEDILDLALEDHACVWSEGLRTELAGILRRTFRSDAEVALTVQQFAELCEFVEPKPLPAPVCRDPDDDLVLATAFAGQADVIITGDKDLLVLKKHQGIRILSPRQFIELLAA